MPIPPVPAFMRALRALILLAALGALATQAPLARAQWRTTYLGSLGGGDTMITGLNTAGQVIGASRIAGGNYHAFIWDAGHMTDLGTLGGAYSWASAISANGLVTGYAPCPASPISFTPSATTAAACTTWAPWPATPRTATPSIPRAPSRDQLS